MRNCLDDIFRKEGQWINIFQGIEEVDDPFEKNTTLTYINPLPVRAIVTDLTSTQASYKMPGIKISRAKTLYIERKYRTLLENSQKIEIRNADKVTESYEGWKENGKFQIRERGQYLEINIFSKHA